MPQTEEVADPRPGIRAVLLTGFLAGNVFGLLYALLSGYLFGTWWSDPYALAALAGILAGVGLVGAMIGTVVGLSARLLLHATGVSESWFPPVFLSGLTSGLLGLCIAISLVGALFESTK